MATIGELLRLSAALSDHSDTPRLDAEVLLCHTLGCDRTYLFTWPERVPAPEQESLFRALLARRQRGEPVAHLTGEREFWSLRLRVSPATLIPRPETELLVETALARLDQSCARVLDLGTGTGAIALALASERPGWQLLAVDKMDDAVALAANNARSLGITNMEVRQSDWFAGVEGIFDLIVSNPPYIDGDDPHLCRGDVRFEPLSALVAADHGLADIAHIAAQSQRFLRDDGLLMVEHGAEQGAAVRTLFAGSGYVEVETLRDLAGLERVTLGVYLSCQCGEFSVASGRKSS